MNRFSYGVANLFGRKPANQFQEVFRYFPVGDETLGISVGLSYRGNSANPLFSIVKHRGESINNTYISLQATELDLLIKAMQEYTFRDSLVPTPPNFVVTDLARPLVITKKEWPNKQWMLFNIQQIRKGRKFTFETPSFNYEKVLKGLIRVHELARARSLELDAEKTIKTVLPLAIAFLCNKKLVETNQSIYDVNWQTLVDEVLADRAQLENLFNHIVEKIKPAEQTTLPTDAEQLKQIGYVDALTIFDGDYTESDTTWQVDLALISLLMREFYKE